MGTLRDKKFQGGRGVNKEQGRSKSGQGVGVHGGDGVGSGPGGGAVTSAGVGSNTLRPLECPRCKYSSKLSLCAGCKKTSGINHCLLHCPSFNVLSVNDKVNIVNDFLSCIQYICF